MLLYQQGFRYFNMGYASAMAMLLLAVSFAVTFMIVRHSRRWVHYQARTGERRGRAVSAPLVRRRAAGAVRRRRFLLAVADHSLLIAAALVFLAPFVFIVADVADDQPAGALARALAGPVRWRNFDDVFHEGAALALRAEHAHLRAASRTLGAARLEHPGRLRARAAALARAATPRS